MYCLEDKLKLLKHCIPMLYTYIKSNQYNDYEAIEKDTTALRLYHLYYRCIN